MVCGATKNPKKFGPEVVGVACKGQKNYCKELYYVSHIIPKEHRIYEFDIYFLSLRWFIGGVRATYTEYQIKM